MRENGDNIGSIRTGQFNRRVKCLDSEWLDNSIGVFLTCPKIGIVPPRVGCATKEISITFSLMTSTLCFFRNSRAFFQLAQQQRQAGSNTSNVSILR